MTTPKKQTGKQHIAVLLKEQEKDARQGIAVRPRSSAPPAPPVKQDASTPIKGAQPPGKQKPTQKFHGNQTTNAQPKDGTLEIGLTKWRRP